MSKFFLGSALIGILGCLSYLMKVSFLIGASFVSDGYHSSNEQLKFRESEFQAFRICSNDVYSSVFRKRTDHQVLAIGRYN